MHAISVTMETAASSGTEFVSVPLLLVKDEPHDDPEMADTNFDLADGTENSEPDPMNLLDPMMELHTFDTPDSETGSEQQAVSGPSKEVWQDWMAEFPWLLHEDEDEHYGYCLYCNNKTSFKVCKSPRTHAQTRNHVENEENYLAFKKSEEHANLSSSPNSVPIKQEFGTDSNISAIKFKRMSQTEPLFNFNWRRWLREHPWLDRDKDDMTHGYCRYCKLRLSVEYSYMRLRHEMSLKHKLAASQYRKRVGEMNEDEVASSTEKQSGLGIQEEESEHDNGNDEETTEQSNKDSEDQNPDRGRLKRKRNPRGYMMKNPWLEMHNNYPRTCRCKLCNVKMIAGNFRRHLRSQAHLESEKIFKSKIRTLPPNVKQEYHTKSRNWKMYSKKHPWLIGDPDDPSFGYCKYCKKRLLYGLHPMKRVVHERSANHVNAEKLYKGRLATANVKGNRNEESPRSEGSDEEVDVDGNPNNHDEGPEENNEGNDSETGSDYEGNPENDNSEQAPSSSRMRVPTGTDEWFAMFPWCERYEKDRSYMYCTYCKVKLKVTFRRKQHERTTRHQEAAENMKLSNTATNLERSKQDKRIRYYPWLVYTKNPQYIFCKYCSTRLHTTASRAKHEKTKRHSESAEKFLALNDGKKPQPTTTMKINQPLLGLTHHSMKAKLVLWKNRFPWLICKRGETQPNYGFCKYCEMRVFVPTDKYAAKHQRSLRHMRIKIQLKRQKNKVKVTESDNRAEPADKNITNTPTTPNQKESNEKFSWLEYDKVDPTYGQCKYCNVRLNVTGVLKVRHEATLKHNKAKMELFKDTSKEGEAAEDQTNQKDKQNSSIIVVEDEVLNDTASVKSEPMDESDVFRYLLQRSVNAPNRDRNNATNNESSDPANNRSKTSTQHENMIERAKRLTTAHLEILRLSRDLNDGKNAKTSGHISLPSSIFNTSAAIAALLSPQRPTAPPPQSAAPTRNNFELFFDSVCESVKTLPTDLAAEGKIKIAQLVADLELRALQRTQSTDITNTSQVQAVGNVMSSTTASSSPTLSAADVPSTTTNGLEKDDTSQATPNESTLAAASSSYSIDQTMRIIPLSSTPIHQQSETTMETSGFRRIQSRPMQAEGNYQRVRVISPHKLIKNHPQNEVPVTMSLANDATTSTPNRSTQAFSPPSQPAVTFQQRTYTQQTYTPSPDRAVSVVPQRFTPQPMKTVVQNSTTVIDNGFRRIHLSARPNQSSTSKEMGFRRIHIPIKGANITKTTSNKLPTPTYYFNNSNNT